MPLQGQCTVCSGKGLPPLTLLEFVPSHSPLYLLQQQDQAALLKSRELRALELLRRELVAGSMSSRMYRAVTQGTHDPIFVFDVTDEEMAAAGTVRLLVCCVCMCVHLHVCC